MSRGCYHDPDHSCPPCSYYERVIRDLREQLWQTTGRIARVEIEEGDQHGTWTRVMQIRDVIATTEGLVIKVA